MGDSQISAARKVIDNLHDLENEAHLNGLPFLAYLLSMARLEALSYVADEPNEDEKSNVVQLNFSKPTL